MRPHRTSGRTVLRHVTLGALVLALSACAWAPNLTTRASPRPVPRIDAPAPVQPAPSAASDAVRMHFDRVQADLLIRGLMRTDGGGPDTPFSQRQLTENFVKIALYDEYLTVGGRLVARQTPSRLRRWESPVRLGLRFGASVSESQRARDRASVVAYAARLSRQTGHPIRVSDSDPNYWIYILSEDERPALGPEWAALFPGLDAADLDVATGMGLSTFCLVLAISEGERPVYTNALAVVRSELPDQLRLSCLHEEIAQGLGLANDSPAARPSIFNDDEEFATLTSHDELLLRILYDTRLRPGMREPEARPIVQTIVAELLGGES